MVRVMFVPATTRRQMVKSPILDPAPDVLIELLPKLICLKFVEDFGELECGWRIGLIFKSVKFPGGPSRSRALELLQVM